MNNQTAVQWLAKQLEDYGDPQVCELTWENLDSLVEQAKEMEKQQIVDAANTFSLFASEEVLAVLNKYKVDSPGESYYKEKYNK